MKEKHKITVFNDIFESRLKALVKRIKEVRKKDKDNKTVLKVLLAEAKQLQKTVKQQRKHPELYSLCIPIDGEIVGEPDSSGPIRIKNTRIVGGLLIIDYEVK